MDDMAQDFGDDAMIDEVEAGPIPPDQFVAMVTQAQNIAADLPEDQLNKIARQVVDDYKMDKDSMSDWLTQMERGLDLAKLVKADKTYPFKNAANVKYPLVTSAALQFNARAYPAIVPADAVVKVQTFGSDPQGAKAARGDRVSAHMSWQLVNQMDEWEEDTDKLLVQLPIVGTMVRKVWYDTSQGRPRSRLLDAGSFIINDKVKTLTDAPRCSEELPLYPSEIRSRILSGAFIEFDYDVEREDKQAAHDFIEQHTRLDLDEDGYEEPYIVTVHKETDTAVRIVADFDDIDVTYKTKSQLVPQQVPQQMPTIGVDGQPALVEMMTTQMVPTEVPVGIMSIRRGSYFIDYKFMPSLDGGFHGTGLGLLLGDISDTINTIINMLLNAGHMASLGGGWIGSDFRIKGGSQRFEPGEWKLANAKGGDIKNSMVPITFPGPDQTLFAMLGMLIDAGKEISSTKDIMTGDSGGKVQTATTTMALIEQGMMVFSAAYKRIFRSLKREYKTLAKVNAETVGAEEYNAFHDEVDQEGNPAMHDPAQDYASADMDIQPTADPRSVTKMQEAAKAQIVMDLAQAGMVDMGEASQRILQAASIPDIEELAPKPDPMQQQMAEFQAKMGMEMAKADLTQKMVDIDLTIARIESENATAMKSMSDAESNATRVKMDALTGLLKERRDEIELTIRAGME